MTYPCLHYALLPSSAAQESQPVPETALKTCPTCWPPHPSALPRRSNLTIQSRGDTQQLSMPHSRNVMTYPASWEASSCQLTWASPRAGPPHSGTSHGLLQVGIPPSTENNNTLWSASHQPERGSIVLSLENDLRITL